MRSTSWIEGTLLMAVRACQMMGWPATSKRGWGGEPVSWSWRDRERDGERGAQPTLGTSRERGLKRVPREEPPTWDQSCQQPVGPGSLIAIVLSSRREGRQRRRRGAGRRRTRMTAFVAPVLPLAFSRCGICNDMVGMGMVFVVGGEEGGGRGGGEDGDAVKSRERGLKLGGSRCPGAQEQWRDPAAAWHKLMWDHLQKKAHVKPLWPGAGWGRVVRAHRASGELGAILRGRKLKIHVQLQFSRGTSSNATSF